jgi:hypothetical protein
MTDFREIAETMLLEGFNAIPLNADKSPVKSLTGTNYLYEPQQVTDAYICDRIGVTCGIASDGLAVIDFDKHQGQDIEAVFSAYVEDQTVMHLLSTGALAAYSTPSGGFHLMFRTGTRYLINTQVLSRYADDNVMIEVRGAGAYVVCHPSDGYQFLAGVELLKLQQLTRDDSDYLLNLARSFNQGQLKRSARPDGSKWGIWDESKPWGRFNVEGADEAKQLLRDAGWQLVTVRKHDGVELWRRPGKQRGVSATFGQQVNMFYVFTSSALPFDLNHAYSPTDILMHLRYNGDWTATKAALSERYKVEVTVEERPTATDQHEFPLEVFPQAIQDYINELNVALNYKKDFVAVSFMFALATLNGNHYKLKVKNGWTAATTFWIAVVGESGVMKTHPINQMLAPLKVLDKNSKEDYDLQMEGYNRLDDKEKKNQTRPAFRQILINDATLEAIHYAHKVNPRGLGYYKDELIGFINDMNKYRKGSDEQFWLESFNNSSYIVNRVTKEPLMLDNIMINIIGSIQPSVLDTAIAGSNGNGMIERFLYTASEGNRYNINRNDINSDWLKWYEASIINIHSTLKDYTEVLTMTDEAFDHFVEIDKMFCEIQNSDNETSGIINYINKMKTYTPRFALLLCLIDHWFNGSLLQVTTSHMLNAGKIANYFIRSARDIFADGQRTSEIKKVRRTLEQKGLTKVEQISELLLKGYSQAEVGREVGVSRVYVHKVAQKVKR